MGAVPNGSGGVLINGTTGETIGLPGQGNVISGNTSFGIQIDPSPGDVIQGNIIGLAADGSTPLGNAGIGIDVLLTSSVTIGGSTAGDGNIISANGGGGIVVEGSTGILIQGNLIGTDKTGLLARGNMLGGVVVEDNGQTGSGTVTVGGTVANSGNVISSNFEAGLLILGPLTTGILVEGNTIGLGLDGTTALGNLPGEVFDGEGIIIENSASNIIGSGNVISANASDGVLVDGGSNSNRIFGNIIGLDSSGTSIRGNAGYGVDLSFGTGNTVGGSASLGFGNVISGNSIAGVNVADNGNIIAGNFIGTSSGGNLALGNVREGIFVSEVTSLTIGGSSADLGNVISGNGRDGIRITQASGVLITSNIIGLSSNSSTSLPNTGAGVDLLDNASGVTVGGVSAGVRNIISGNTGAGVSISGSGATHNLVAGNFIGLATNGSAIHGNSNGVVLDGVSGNTIGGLTSVTGAGGLTTLSANVISGNLASGVALINGASGNPIIGNLIGTDATGLLGRGNVVSGVSINAAGNVLGGSTSGSGNVISGNPTGVIVNAGTSLIQGNLIGLSEGGTASVGNTIGVQVLSGTGSTIGGPVGLASNVISGNTSVGIDLFGGTQTLIVGNLIGTNLAGTAAASQTQDGIHIDAGSTSAMIGGLTSTLRNIVSGNVNGVVFSGGNATLIGDYIGLNLAGTGAVGNSQVGVLVQGASTNVTIGGTAAGSADVISGNGIAGIALNTGANIVVGDLIGTNATGAAKVGTQPRGVSITGLANIIGGSTASARNVIAGNTIDDILISGGATTGNLVIGNYIGLASNGTTGLSNSASGGTTGIESDSPGNTIGGAGSGLGNIIASEFNGIALKNASGPGNIVLGNTLGLASDGKTAVSDNVGIVITGTLNTVGGISLGTGNVVVNGLLGIDVTGASATFNVIAGNDIGVLADGKTAAPNGTGVLSELGAASNTIGGSSTVSANVISGNSLTGLALSTGATTNLVAANFVGLASDGKTVVGDPIGISISGSTTTSNTIGGSSTSFRNLIAGNANTEVLISGAVNNLVANNFIGADSTGVAASIHATTDVSLVNASNNRIGGVGLGNLIVGATGAGVGITTSSSGNLVAVNTIGGAGSLGNGVGVQVDGASSGNVIGGSITGVGNAIGGNGTGVVIVGATTTLVGGNTIGGTVGNTGDGVSIGAGASGTTIGGTVAEARNIISTNGGNGIHINGGSTVSVFGNYIGTNPSGTAASGNTLSGVLLQGSTNLTIGGTAGGSGNLISGNGSDGVMITGGSGNFALSNSIGVNAAVTAAVPNGKYGVEIFGSANNTVGDASGATRNIISGNSLSGVFIHTNISGDSSGNVVTGNLIGTDANNNNSIGNGNDAVLVDGGTNTTIGGVTSTAGNIIRGSVQNGVHFTNAATGLIAGNTIGIDRTSATGNLGNGVEIDGTSPSNITVGGTTPGAKNVITGNGGAGDSVQGGSNILIAGNQIGQIGSVGEVGNSLSGIVFNSTMASTIGMGNVISGNGGDGVRIVSSSNDLIIGNEIGTDQTGTVRVINQGNGIQAISSTGLTIGGVGAGASNVLSGNSLYGVAFVGTSSSLIINNKIGAAPGGNTTVSNLLGGVELLHSSSNTINGGNVISGNGGPGILISTDITPSADHNLVAGNTIGAVAIGTSLGNAGSGVLILNASNNTIGGGNLISGNGVGGSGGAGVSVSGGAGTMVLSNLIGTNPSGSSAVANNGDGVSFTNSSNGAITSNLISGNAVDGVRLTSLSSVLVAGNTIGTDVTGNTAVPNGTTAATEGVLLDTVTQVTVGGATTARNLISGNAGIGVHIKAGSGNLIVGNFIGTKVGGSSALANQGDGIKVENSSSNTIGGAGTSFNLVSGNAGNAGIEIVGGSLNVVAGNEVGTDSTGASAVPNTGVGILLTTTTSTTVGLPTALNLVSGGSSYGIEDSGGSNNQFQNNIVGTNLAETATLPNTLAGIFLSSTTNDTVGGAALTSGNLISGNRQQGVLIMGTIGNGSNLILGNTIGAGAGGIGLGNTLDGVAIAGSPSNTIKGNIIAANHNDGVLVGGPSTLIVGNQIGLNASGGLLGNTAAGVEVTGSGTTIGGSTVSGIANVISANNVGIQLDSSSANTIVLGNFVGTNPAGTTAAANSIGILVTSSSATTIGGTSAAQSNIVSGNTSYGIELNGAKNILVQGNRVGTGVDGASPLGNGADGIYVLNSSSNVTIGGAFGAGGNIVGANKGDGIHLDGSSGILVSGNLVGQQTAAASALGNSLAGIEVHGGTAVTIGGTASTAGNVIAGNAFGAAATFTGGLLISSATGTLVENNKIGTDAAGSVALGNAKFGVVLLDAANVTVGKIAGSSGNLISGNQGAGVIVVSDNAGTSSGNQIAGNTIGLSATNAILANQGDGVLVQSAMATTIGGSASGAGNVISGNTGNGISILSNASGTLVIGNFIGTDTGGTIAEPNNLAGVSIFDSSNNSIGGSRSSGFGNVISGNKADGVRIVQDNNGFSNQNMVAGNLIGVDKTGMTALPNAGAGVTVTGGTTKTTIGGATADLGNVISANSLVGVAIQGGTFALVANNLIGTNQNGTAALGNGGDGVLFSSTSTSTIQNNLISGNGGNGVHILGLNPSGLDDQQNVVIGNTIGGNATATVKLANVGAGILTDHALSATIGGLIGSTGNLILGNGGDGVSISGGSGIVVAGNLIGTNASGAAGLGNGGDGVTIHDSLGNTLGGTSATARNVISGNLGAGVQILGTSSTNILVGNYIGVNPLGSAVLPNGVLGDVILSSVSGNMIGGSIAGAANVISGSATSGIVIQGGQSNLVQGNKIGTDATGLIGLGNNGDGILIVSSLSNTIGGLTLATRNQISGNSLSGVHVMGTGLGSDTTGNLIASNLIGLDATGGVALPNGGDGVFLDTVMGTIVGGVSFVAGGNVISGNDGHGVHIKFGSANLIEGNRIGTKADGTGKVPNLLDGVFIENSGLNTIGGPVASNGNTIIASATGAGIHISGSLSGSNVVQNNVVGPIIIGGLDGLLLDGAVGEIIGGPGAGNVFSGNTRDGIRIINGSTNNLIVGNLIGLLADGKTVSANGMDGIFIGDSSNNTVGGTAAGLSNLISGNTQYGVHLAGSSTGNLIIGDKIGTDSFGTAAKPNLLGGVFLENVSSNTVGGSTSGSGNLISGNGVAGVLITGTSVTSDLVIGNTIGTNVTGTAALPNTGDGVLLNGMIRGVNVVNNLISGNTMAGVHFEGGAFNDQVFGNVIGLAASGLTPLPNGTDGVLLDSTTGITIGGTGLGQGNIISGNAINGVEIDHGSANTLLGNLIGTDTAGLSAIGNGGNGVLLSLTTGDIVGGSSPAARNLISGNLANGVQIVGDLSGASNGNVLIGNYIGLDSAGTNALANHGAGVTILNADNTTIGGPLTGSRNVISGNSLSGVSLSGGTGNVVLNDLIGTNATGLSALGNGGDGVDLSSNAANNTIGGLNLPAGPRLGNVISGNGGFGVHIIGAAATGNLLIGNVIGLDVTGGGKIGNTLDGVFLDGAGNATIGGSTAALNVISGNGGAGVEIKGGSMNLIQSNYIGLNLGGSTGLPNNGDGLKIASSSNNTIGGIGNGLGNVISGNGQSGLTILGTTSSDAANNLIEGNLIGTDATGSYAVANLQYGVVLTTVTGATIGGAAVGSANVISGNNLSGLEIVAGGSDVIAGNLIGTNSTGIKAIPNVQNGVLVSASGANVIGGLVPASGSVLGSTNVISGNGLNGIKILGPGADGNLIVGNFLGTDILGANALGNGVDGILIASASLTTIGGASAPARNVISGNGGAGVEIQTGQQNLIEDNYIGVNASGTGAIANNGDGVKLLNASANTVGFGNVISGNRGSGVDVAVSVSGVSTNNLIAGNLIGTDFTGLVGIANSNDGVLLNGVSGNTIGGTVAANQNVISGNLGSGVHVVNATTGDLILGNLIGLAGDGTSQLGNNADGVFIQGSSGVVIGGISPNAISGNNRAGVHVQGGSANLIAGNLIGTDLGGSIGGLGDATDGVFLDGSTLNTVGGSTLAARNIISNNTRYGVRIVAPTSGQSKNLVAGNYIGLNALGTLPFGNGLDGVALDGASFDTIGGSTAVFANVISANGGNGVHLFKNTSSQSPTNELIEGNRIGTDASGMVGLGNLINGVLIEGGTTNVTVGGSGAAGNLISGSGGAGVSVSGGSAVRIAGNLIGTNATALSAIGNGGDGVVLAGVTNVIIGGSASGGFGNSIGGNGGAGVHIQSGTPSTNVLIAGNLLGFDHNGAQLGNTGDGALVESGTFVTIGGLTADSRNVIGRNTGSGIHLLAKSQSSTTNDLIIGNYMGTDPTGTTSVANSGDGIRIEDAFGDTVGGSVAGALNLISGNTGNGVHILGVGGASSLYGAHLVVGNLIGTNVSGTGDLHNGLNGILIEDAAANTIGGTNTFAGGSLVSAGNVIAFNGQSGIQINASIINSPSSAGNLIVGNAIGTDATGSVAQRNVGDGVQLNGPTATTIGGTSALLANVISGNSANGVHVHTGTGTLIVGNLIGTSHSGLSPVPNNLVGVLIDQADHVTVGGIANGSGNIISANGADGVEVFDTNGLSSFSNLILGNRIGVGLGGGALANSGNGVDVQNSRTSSVSANLILDNKLAGVLISGLTASGNSVGGVGLGNTIGGNSGDGVAITLGASANLVAGNLIGLFTAGGVAGNSLEGVRISGVGTSLNTVGGVVSNTIIGNGGDGVGISANASNNLVAGNQIGPFTSGSPGLSNGLDGVLIESGAGNTVGGTTVNLANTITGNGGDGVGITSGAKNNLVIGNFIGTDGLGQTGLGNNRDGVLISGVGTSNNTIGGPGASVANVIASNGGNGVEIGAGAFANLVANDVIGTTASFQTGLGNALSGVLITGVGAVNNTIGGSSGVLIADNSQNGVAIVSGAANNLVAEATIAFNNGDGVLIAGTGTTGNTVGGTTSLADLIIGNGQNGVEVSAGAFSNLVAGDLIGTDASGTPNLGNFRDGVLISGANSNTIGGTAPNAINVISGNAGNGVDIAASATNNLVVGDVIGLSVSGQPLGNAASGVLISASSLNTIGGMTTGIAGNLGSSNVIAGNILNGVTLDAGATKNLIAGNLIGTDLNGTSGLGNFGDGVNIAGTSNTIGGSLATLGNTIAGNVGNGLALANATTNLIANNLIGFANGRALGNSLSGVFASGAASNTIGGVGIGNLIVANGQSGIQISNVSSNDLVVGNLIGTDSLGTGGLGNSLSGIDVSNSSNITIGGKVSGAVGVLGLGNVVSGNQGNGILIENNAQGVLVAGNLIGLALDGSTVLGNMLNGVQIENSTLNTVGGGEGATPLAGGATLAAAFNVIVGNFQNGVAITGDGGGANLIEGNAIGVNPFFATTPAPNQGDGVFLPGGFNIIGGVEPFSSNLIEFNLRNGVEILGSSGSSNIVEANTIEANTLDGVLISDASGNQIFGPGQEIDFNGGFGVHIMGAGATSNQVAGNDISQNALDGVFLDGASSNLIGGSQLSAENVIFSNGGSGVLISGGTAAFNQVSFNLIQANALDGVKLDGPDVSNNVIGGTTTIGNFIVSNLGNGIHILDGSHDNSVQGNNIGFSPTFANGLDGILIENSTLNQIGGTTPEGNTIVASKGAGIHIVGGSGGFNLVENNLIGTDSSLSATLGGLGDGILIDGSPGNLIGGSGLGNTIAGNAGDAIHILNGALGGNGANANIISGNFLGIALTNSLGAITTSLGNKGDGVTIDNSPSNIVGGSVTGSANTIVFNSGVGVRIRGASATGNLVLGNLIGTDGTRAEGNSHEGVLIDSANGNSIGFAATSSGNQIASNLGDGIHVLNASGNVILLNAIGLVGTGLGNAGDGVHLENASGNTVGVAGFNNTIVKNGANGIELQGASSSANLIQANLIGGVTNKDTTTKAGNLGDGILISGGMNNTVGGIIAADANTIVANQYGIHMTSAASGNVVLGNFIGTDIHNAALGNSQDGILLSGVSANTIGSTTAGVINVIAGNTVNGVEIAGGSTGNLLLNNDIGTDPSDTAPSNGGDGVMVAGAGTTNNTIGAAIAGVSNLISHNQGNGIHILAGSSGTVIVNNLIGTDSSGTGSDVPNFLDGIRIEDSSNNTIGGPLALARNVISANLGNGVQIRGTSTANLIEGDYIGVDFTGTNRDGNGGNGVFLNGVGGNTISGAFTGTNAGSSVISGNSLNGVAIEGALATGNVLFGNLIGLNARGTAALANGNSGVEINNAPSNLIGGAVTLGASVAAESNVISGNARDGILLVGNVAGTLIQANLIGTNLLGSLDVGNLGSGVHVNGVAVTTTGIVIRDNVISANGVATVPRTGGVYLQGAGATGIVVVGNNIGTDITGMIAVGNKQDGVLVDNATGNTIGGMTSTDRNVISGNNQPVSTIATIGYSSGGVHLLGASATGNYVIGNYIGLDVTGATALPNRQDGVLLNMGAHDNFIGGIQVGARNIISGNGFNGIEVDDAGTTNNLLVGNFVGTDQSGEAVKDSAGKGLGNAADGVRVMDAPAVVIGGSAIGAGNVISGNAGEGVNIVGTTAGGVSGAVIQNNIIGLDLLGEVPLGNALDGVKIGAAFPGSAGFAAAVIHNVISANIQNGILIAGSQSVVVQGNKVGTDRAGTLALGNVKNGVQVFGSNFVTIGGTNAGNSNVISGNLGSGIDIDDLRSTLGGMSFPSVDNTIEANFIGTNLINSQLGNHVNGVLLEGNSTGNTIGGSTAFGNSIYANAGSGVLIQANAQGNLVAGNTIGNTIYTPGGALDLGNLGDGVKLASSNNYVVGGNVITANHGSGVRIIGAGVTGNIVTNDLIGISAANVVQPNLGDGLTIDGASYNTIGQAGPDGRNVISGNGVSGIQLVNGASNNLLQNNIIGLDINGASSGNNKFGNSSYGILISQANNNIIGGLANVGSISLVANIVSGNKLFGVAIVNNSTGNLLEGDVIGLDPTGHTAMGNNQAGVFINFSVGNTIGGVDAAARNFISGNGAAGVQINGAVAGVGTGNLVAGNFIGTDVTGLVPIGNKFDGVQLSASPFNTIGGTVAGAKNVIAANNGAGVRVTGIGASYNVIAGNNIGTDITGEKGSPLGNGLDGVLLESASSNLIGGPTPAWKNLISDNSRNGISLNNGANSNVILNNFIGTDTFGTKPLGNGLEGILVSDSVQNQIGLQFGNGGNLISSNAANGVEITGSVFGASGVDYNQVQGNLIGTSADGEHALPNSLDGVLIDEAVFALIGGSLANRNLISGNLGSGVHIRKTNGTIGVSYNTVGLDENGDVMLPNLVDGVFLDGSSFITVDHDLISGNAQLGVNILSGFGQDTGGIGNNLLTANTIGTNAKGDTAIANLLGGVFINSSQNNYIGLPNAAIGTLTNGNLISGNYDHSAGLGVGVEVFGPTSTNNVIQGNFIGTSADGSNALANPIGIYLNNTPSNLIGGALPGQGNVISGNDQSGVRIEGNSASFNLLLGNYIGTNSTATTIIQDFSKPSTDPTTGLDENNRQEIGVLILNATKNTIGPASYTIPFSALSAHPVPLNPGFAKNVISGNVEGLQISGLASANNVVRGNYIGTNAAGTNAARVGTVGGFTIPLGNYSDGVFINNTGQQTAGNPTGQNFVQYNLISGNADSGIQIYGQQSTNNLLVGNYIGTDLNGNPLVTYGTVAGRIIHDGNQHGILLNGASFNHIGLGPLGNLIAYNRDTGIYLLGPNNVAGTQTVGPTIGNTISGNRITGNGSFGILVYNTPITSNPIFQTGKNRNFFSNQPQDIRPFAGATLPDTGPPQSTNPILGKHKKTKAKVAVTHPHRAPGFQKPKASNKKKG